MKRLYHLLKFTLWPVRYWLLAGWLIALLPAIIYACSNFNLGYAESTIYGKLLSWPGFWITCLGECFVALKLGSSVAVQPRDEFHDARPVAFWQRVLVTLLAGLGLCVILPLFLSPIAPFLGELQRTSPLHPDFYTSLADWPSMLWFVTGKVIFIMLTCFTLSLTGLSMLVCLMSLLVIGASTYAFRWLPFYKSSEVEVLSLAASFCVICLLLRKIRNPIRPLFVFAMILLATFSFPMLLSYLVQTKERRMANAFLEQRFSLAASGAYSVQLSSSKLDPKSKSELDYILEFQSKQDGPTLDKLSMQGCKLATRASSSDPWKLARVNCNLSLDGSTGRYLAKVQNYDQQAIELQNGELKLSSTAGIDIPRSHIVRRMKAKVGTSLNEDGFLTRVSSYNPFGGKDEKIALSCYERRPSRDRKAAIRHGKEYKFSNFFNDINPADADSELEIHIYDSTHCSLEIELLATGATLSIPGIPVHDKSANGSNVFVSSDRETSFLRNAGPPTDFASMLEHVKSHTQSEIEPYVASQLPVLIDLLKHGIEEKKVGDAITNAVSEHHKQTVLAAFPAARGLVNCILEHGWTLEAKTGVAECIQHAYGLLSYDSLRLAINAGIPELDAVLAPKLFAGNLDCLKNQRTHASPQLQSELFKLASNAWSGRLTPLMELLIQSGHEPALRFMLKQPDWDSRPFLRTQSLSAATKEDAVQVSFQPHMGIFITTQP